MADAGEAVERDGHPIILWNARSNARLAQTEQIFIYLHECAHHVLGHLYHRGTEARDELEADCWAIQLMVDGGMIKPRQLAVLESSRQSVRGDETHLGGEAHVRSLEQCLSLRTDAKAWAVALDTVVVAARDSFSSRRGRLLDAQSTPEVYEALLDLPGTYDCEIVGAALRCAVFTARSAGPAEGRYHRLLKILRGWLPGRVKIERQAMVEGGLTLRDPRTARVLWTGQASYNLLDAFPKGQLSLVEDPRYTDLKSNAPTRNVDKLVEPVIVVAVVVGLVALFFQNRP